MHASNSLFQTCFVCKESKCSDINIHHFQVVTLPAQYVFIQQPISQHKYSFKACELRQSQLSYSVNHSICKYRYSLTTLTTGAALFWTLLSTAFWLSVDISAITHPSEVAHSLEVDKVAFAWVQRAVPVAIVSVIVAHSEGTCVWEAAGWQLRSVVVWCATGLRLTMGHRQWEAILKPEFPLHFLPCFLLNHYLVCTGDRGVVQTFNKPWMVLKKEDPICTVEMISSPNRCPSALGGTQQDCNCAFCLTEGGRHVSIIKRGSWGYTETV